MAAHSWPSFCKINVIYHANAWELAGGDTRASRDTGKGGDTYYTRVLGARKGRQGFSVKRKDRIVDFQTEKK
jgi:hypothetical protein